MVKNASPILSALRAATQSEAAAVEFLELQRWGNTPACPRCGSVNVYRMTSAGGNWVEITIHADAAQQLVYPDVTLPKTWRLCYVCFAQPASTRVAVK